MIYREKYPVNVDEQGQTQVREILCRYEWQQLYYQETPDGIQ